MLLLSPSLILAQRPTAKATPKPRTSTVKPKATPTPTPEPTPTPDPAAVEAELFDKAHSATELKDRISLLEKFIVEFPASERIAEVRESLLIARPARADEMLDSGDIDGGLALLRKTIEDSPDTTPDRFFSEVIMKIPGNLYFRGLRDQALEHAALIEKRVGNNAARLAELANFYIAVENGSEATRIATKATEIDPASSAAYQTLGMTYRLNFELEKSLAAFEKAYQLDSNSASALRGLADLERALGRSESAAGHYKQVLSVNENDVPAQAGYVLSLFDAGKKAEAEAAMAASLEKSPNNLPLLAGAAYWYASSGQGEKAIELSQRAIALEPRYVWSHIALARGQMAAGKPVDAEKTLLSARKYGNFPTLDLEIALARFAAGFFRDASDELNNRFKIENGEARTLLGGRVERVSTDLIELVAAERQASILAPRGPGDHEAAVRLFALKAFLDQIRNESPDADALVRAADQFVGGSDPMQIHRALFVAEHLLEKKVAVAKASELISDSAGMAEAGLGVPSPAAAVMAGELYGARSLAASRGEFLLVPEVSKQTLSAILRGRVEELAGWALMEQGNNSDAAVRFRRGLSVLPEKSAWWRSAKWRLGNALVAEGKEAEALETYIESYDREKPDIVKYIVVEALYRKLNNGTDGLEAKIGASPLPQTLPLQSPTPSDAQPPTEIKTTETAVSEKVALSETPAPSSTVPQDVQPVEENKTPEKKPESDPPDAKPEPETTPAPEQNPTVETPAEPRTEAKPEQTVKTSEATVAKESVPLTAKPLFEPIVITIPKSGERGNTSTENKKPDDKPSQTEPLVAETEKEKAEELPVATDVPAKTVEQPEPPTAEPVEAPVSQDAGAVRPRLVAGKEVSGDLPLCTIGVSQENVSLINGGGTIGILVSIEGEGDIRSLKAISSSQEDIQVTIEPEIAGVSGRAFFIVKSTSTKLGLYQVSFAAPCGKRSVVVQVR